MTTKQELRQKLKDALYTINRALKEFKGDRQLKILLQRHLLGIIKALKD